MDKRKELAKRCAALEAEVQTQAGLQGEVQRLEQRCQQLQVSLCRKQAQQASLRPWQWGQAPPTYACESQRRGLGCKLCDQAGERLQPPLSDASRVAQGLVDAHNAMQVNKP